MLEDTVRAIAGRTTLYAYKYWVEVSGNFSVMRMFEQTFTQKKRQIAGLVLYFSKWTFQAVLCAQVRDVHRLVDLQS